MFALRTLTRTLPLVMVGLANPAATLAQGDPATHSAATEIAVIRGADSHAAVVEAPVPSHPADPQAPPARSAKDLIARGDYLVRILGCNDCHTPLKMGPNGPAPDMTRMLSGHPESLAISLPDPMPAEPWAMVGSATNTAFAGPWGITFAMNLTPDENTGMGIWSEQMFVDALRKGRHMGTSRPIMPPMPWSAYANMDDADLTALYAYLRSIPAISNRVPDYQPPASAEEPLEE